MTLRSLPLCAVCVGLLTISPSNAQERTAVTVTIGGMPIPPEVQPRVSVEQQRGAVDEARIRVSGTQGVAYASAIVDGDPVEIVALALDAASIPIFTGHVRSVDYGFDEGQTVVVIRASSPLPHGDAESPERVTITPRSASGGPLLAFAPRLSATSSIGGVLVTGVNAATGEPVTGRAMAQAILLGPGSDEPFGVTVVVDTDRRFESTAEASAFAWAVLSELLASRISAEAVTEGTPGLEPGSFVEIEGIDREFQGAYYVTGVKHDFGPDSYGGYSSAFRLRRADFAMFRVPSIDDEVLVAFERGDISQPYIVDSWWACDSRTPSGSSDDNDRCRILRWPW